MRDWSRIPFGEAAQPISFRGDTNEWFIYFEQCPARRGTCDGRLFCLACKWSCESFPTSPHHVPYRGDLRLLPVADADGRLGMCEPDRRSFSGAAPARAVGIAGPACRHRRAHDQGRPLRRRRGRQGQRGSSLPAAPGARDLHGRALRRFHLGGVPLRQSDARKYHHRHRDLRHLHRRALPRETLWHEARG